MSHAQYQISLHPDAKKSLDNLESRNRERVTNTLTDVAQTREVAKHPNVEIMHNQQDVKLYKIRVGDFRVLAHLEKPTLKVLQIGRRNGFYSDVDKVAGKLAGQ